MCKHNFVWTRNKFVCVYCKKSYRPRQAKIRFIRNISVIISVVVLGVFFAPHFMGYIACFVPSVGSCAHEATMSENTGASSNDRSPPQEPIIPALPTLNDYSTEQLRQIALDDINYYRQHNSVSPLKTLNFQPSQTYAELLLSERCIHHMNDDGTAPQGRFQKAGINSFLISENVAGGMKALLEDKAQFIKDRDHDMMFKDAGPNHDQPGPGGHTRNILDPASDGVSLGIAYDDTNMVIVQDFEQTLRTGESSDPESYTETPDQKNCW